MPHPALKKLRKRQSRVSKKLASRHQAARKLLQASTISGLLLLSQPARPKLPPGTTKRQLAEHGFLSEAETQDQLKKLKLLLPSTPGKVSEVNVHQVMRVIEEAVGVRAVQRLDNYQLNHSFGWIGYEQHLRRFPGDGLKLHQQELEAGMAPGLGAWGYFSAARATLSQEDALREQYYVAVQTMYTPEWNRDARDLREWYKYRKVIVINVDNGKAAIAVIADAGPARWTGKQFGGSPELMAHLKLDGGMQRSKVLLWFVKDEPNPPIGPLQHHLKLEKLSIT